MFLFIDKKFICWTTEWSVRKYVNTSFFQTCNINCGQCVIKLTRRAKGHHWVFSSDSKLADKLHHLVSYYCNFDFKVGFLWAITWSILELWLSDLRVGPFVKTVICWRSLCESSFYIKTETYADLPAQWSPCGIQ